MAERSGESGLQDTAGPSVAPPVRVAVCVPHSSMVDSGFAFCLAEMMAAVGATAEGLMEVRIMPLDSTLVEVARSRLTQAALQWGATHILWLDSDMLFPPDTLHRLLARNKDIVGANYCTRRFPYRPTAYKCLPSSFGEEERCMTYPDSTGLEEVAAIGLGCALVRASVFSHVPPPGFQNVFEPERRRWVGEDVTFCTRAREAGFVIWVDHDLSKMVAHAGRLLFTAEHMQMLNPRKLVAL